MHIHIGRKAMRGLMSLIVGLCAGGALMSAAEAGSFQTRMALGRACHDDYQKYCSGVEPGDGRLLVCLNQHAGQLSPGCHDALKQAGKLTPASPKSAPAPQSAQKTPA